MRRVFLPLFNLTATLTSYGIAVASSALLAGVLTFVFVLYYSRSINLPYVGELVIFLITSTGITAILHALYFGILHPFGFSGLRRRIRELNRFVQRTSSPFKLKIADGLSPKEYRDLLKTLTLIPRENAYVSAAMILVNATVMFYIFIKHFHYGTTHQIQVGVIASIALFLHGGFTLIISELATGDMRAQCKKVMHDAGIHYRENVHSTVRLKIIFFILILIVTLFISNFLTYNGAKIGVVLRFSLLAIFISTLMAYMIFSLILRSLKEIENAAADLRMGGDGYIFPESLDKEFINVANGFIRASKTIRDYQHNLEKKVDQRTAELTQAYKELQAKDKMIQVELDFASDIQKGIIPSDFEEWNGLRISGYFRPMEKVTGDYYDVFNAHGNRLGVLMADVSGHGIPAALVTTMAKVAFGKAAQNTYSPAATFREVNDQLTALVTTQEYLTAFYLTIDETHHFYYANASHQMGKIYRKTKDKIENLDTHGLFIGALKEASDSYEEKESRLYQGDRLILYTDGIIETRNPQNEDYGHERFEAAIKKFAHLDASEMRMALIQDFNEFLSDSHVSDDLSLLVVEVDSRYSVFLTKLAGAYEMIESGHKKEAAAMLDEATRIYGKHRASLKLAGDLNYELKRYLVSEDFFRRYLEVNMQDADVYFKLSSLALKKRDFLTAEKYARDAIGLRAGYALAYNNLGVSLHGQRKTELAMEALEKARHLDPENLKIQRNLASLNIVGDKS